MDYVVVKAKSRKALKEEVETLLKDGFELAPGFAVGFDPGAVAPNGIKTGQEIYYQPMVKKDMAKDIVESLPTRKELEARLGRSLYKPGEEPQDMSKMKIE